MTELRCRFNGADNPRVLVGHHDADCPGDQCDGCQDCDRAHCPACGVRHSATACEACLTAARDDLQQIARLCADDMTRLLVEAARSHSDGRHGAAPMGGEAMAMLGPGSPGESRTCLAERGLDAAHVDDERWAEQGPPLLVLATWEDDWRIQFGHGGGLRATVDRAADYLARNLTRAGSEHPAFDEFAADLRRLRARLEAVIHDQPQGDLAGIPCFDCGGDLERKLTDRGLEDHWTCRRCRRRYTDPEYHLAVRAKIEGVTG